MSKPIENRFWEKVRKTENCWLWEGAQAGSGYGTFCGADGKMTSAHRIAYWLVNGDIPPGYVICHKCDVKLCVNPDHLWCGTQQQNVDDMIQKGRFARGKQLNHAPQNGSLNNNAKTNEDNVVLVRKLLDQGMSQAEVARRTGIKRGNVWCIKHRKSWKEL